MADLPRTKPWRALREERKGGVKEHENKRTKNRGGPSLSPKKKSASKRVYHITRPNPGGAQNCCCSAEEGEKGRAQKKKEERTRGGGSQSY